MSSCICAVRLVTLLSCPIPESFDTVQKYNDKTKVLIKPATSVYYRSIFGEVATRCDFTSMCCNECHMVYNFNANIGKLVYTCRV